MNNKDAVLDYLDVAFNQKNLAKAKTYWAADMIQHNPGMPNGLDVLHGLIGNADPTLAYEAGLAMEEGDKVMVHGRYSGWNGKTMIAVDIFRVDGGKVVKHWDVMQEEVPAERLINGHAMFPA